MLNNLVIGNTSQISHYFPDNYTKISSRNIDYSYHSKMKYDNVYICFSEQRTFIKDNPEIFFDTNVKYTIDVINFFEQLSNRIVIFGTSELWNNIEGPININTPFNYNYSPYIKSKETLIKYIYEHKNYKRNVIILHPFNFNTPYRKGDYLFGKVFNSLINKKKIEIGNTDFNREIISPRFVVERSIKAEKDEIIGSGNLINVNKFIKDLYNSFNMKYEDYVTENINHNFKIQKEFYSEKKTKYNYDTILKETVEDLKKIRIKK